MWDDCNCVIVLIFFGIAFLCDWNENWSFPVLGHCWVFQICWHIECSTFTASSFRIWYSSTGILSPPLALFVVMLPKARLTSQVKLPKSAGSLKKPASSRKRSISALLTMPKLLTVWITRNCRKLWRRWEYQTTWPASWETCMQVRKQQLELHMEQQSGSK